MNPARARCGAISLSIDSHLPAMPASNSVRPVRLPPGRARFAMKPEPIGSLTKTNTIGIARVSRWNAAVIGVDCARITSGRALQGSSRG